MCLIKGAFVGEKNFDVIKMQGTTIKKIFRNIQCSEGSGRITHKCSFIKSVFHSCEDSYYGITCHDTVSNSSCPGCHNKRHDKLSVPN